MDFPGLPDLTEPPYQVAAKLVGALKLALASTDLSSISHIDTSSSSESLLSVDLVRQLEIFLSFFNYCFIKIKNNLLLDTNPIISVSLSGQIASVVV